MSTYCPGVPHDSHAEASEPCPVDHPMHIYRVRARRSIDEAERNLFAEVEPQRQTPFGMLKRALEGDS